MRLPGFNAETSLYKTSRHYRMTGKFGQAYGTIYPTLSISNLFKTSLAFIDLISTSLGDSFYVDRPSPISVKGCWRQCLGSIPCADESCRRQRDFSCTRKCGPVPCSKPGQTPCHFGRCCEAGEVCTLDGCFHPNSVCRDVYGDDRLCLGRCLPSGCCPTGNVVCNNRCCEIGWSCTSAGCCPPGVCCESTACPPDKFCCGGKICCPDGAECRPINGTSEYGCFR